MPKKPTYKSPEKPRRAKGKNAGAGGGHKTRPDVPATNENRAATGKRVVRRTNYTR